MWNHPQHQNMLDHLQMNVGSQNLQMNARPQHLQMNARPQRQQINVRTQHLQIMPDHNIHKWMSDHNVCKWMPDHNVPKWIPDHSIYKWIPYHNTHKLMQDHISLGSSYLKIRPTFLGYSLLWCHQPCWDLPLVIWPVILGSTLSDVTNHIGIYPQRYDQALYVVTWPLWLIIILLYIQHTRKLDYTSL